MQSLINISKFVILAVLSFSLIITWNSNNTQFASAGFTNTDENASVQSVDSVWNSMSRDFHLTQYAQPDQVQAEIRKLLANPDQLYHILQSAAPYIYFIHQQTEARGLPAEIALIPFVESEFNPNDRSTKGATGLWQLMSGTAHELGVKVKTGYDGRRNVVASTKAALAYFKDLGNNFKGNWYLAIAAYDCGPMKIESAERRTGSHSFWNLPLPRETKYYVPKLLAVAAIIKNPEKYGVQLPPINNQPYFAALKVAKPVNLSQLAQSSGVSVATLHTLNPDYNHSKAPAGNSTHLLLVPVNKVSAVTAQLPAAQVTNT